MYAIRRERIRSPNKHKMYSKKLPKNIQIKWLKLVDSIEHIQFKKAVFADLVIFIQQEVCMLSHPDYEYTSMVNRNTNSNEQIKSKLSKKYCAMNKRESEIKVISNDKDN